MRVASLDILRGIAAFAVATTHFGLYADFYPRAAEVISVMAVEVFFALSGYVLAPQIIGVVNQPSRFSTFLVRRWMRTLPAYFAALACFYTVYGFNGSWGDLLRYVLYVQNFFGQHNYSDYFSIAWSLAVEEWFYLLFPAFLLSLTIKQRNHRRIIWAAIAFIALVSILRALVGHSENWGASVRRVTIFRVDSIAYGFLLYAFSAGRQWSVPGVVALAVASTTVFAITAASALFSVSYLSQFAFPYAAAISSTSIVWACVLLDRGTTSAVALWSGRISYSVYLFHVLVAAVIFSLLPTAPVGVLFLFYLLCCCVVSLTVYQFVERPFLEARPPYAKTTNSLYLAQQKELQS